MFVLVSLFVSIVGYMYLCNTGILNSRNYYYFYIRDVSKIDKGTVVRLNGTNVGTVCNIQFSDETLLSKVTIGIKKRLKLNENSEIVISGIDLLFKNLDINLNDGDILRNNSEVKLVDISLKSSDIIAKFNNVLNNLNSISQSVNNTTKNIDNSIQKLHDNDFVGKVNEACNIVVDILNRVKLPWFLRK